MGFKYHLRMIMANTLQIIYSIWIFPDNCHPCAYFTPTRISLMLRNAIWGPQNMFVQQTIIKSNSIRLTIIKHHSSEKLYTGPWYSKRNSSTLFQSCQSILFCSHLSYSYSQDKVYTTGYGFLDIAVFPAKLVLVLSFKRHAHQMKNESESLRK